MTDMVSIFIFDRMEVLDFAGPFEVFATASRLKARQQPDAPALFEVVTIAEQMHTVRARGGLMLVPHFNFASHTQTDILIIPGGNITAELAKPSVIDWIADSAQSARITASVCTGAFFLAKAGLLDKKEATTHWEDTDDLQSQFPLVNVKKDRRWIDTGAIVTSAGISAGIDMSLHLVARLAGEDLALRTAHQIEYKWKPGKEPAAP
jgi:transcriptional regulator GlxA family with amidase domain